MNIPDKCYALNNMTIDPKTGYGKVIEIRAMETGYYKTIQTATQAEVNQKNDALGVDKATAFAMYDASVFGWQVYQNCLKSHQEREMKRMVADPDVRREFRKLLVKIKKMSEQP